MSVDVTNDGTSVTGVLVCRIQIDGVMVSAAAGHGRFATALCEQPT